jgi:steroid delta-isomerase-like uncharacterized protein
MSAEENKALAQRFEDMLSTGNLELVDELCAPDFAAYMPGVLAPLDREGWKEFARPFVNGFSDRQLMVDGVVAEGDQVVVRHTISGRHTGNFQGIPPTDRRVEVAAMGWFRLSDGKIVEHWTVLDLLGVMQQLGAVPPAGEEAGS